MTIDDEILLEPFKPDRYGKVGKARAPSRKCRRLVHLEDDFCPHCGCDLVKWREQWAIGLLAFASFSKGMGTSWITGPP